MNNEINKVIEQSLTGIKEMYKKLEGEDKQIANNLIEEFENKTKKMFNFDNGEVVKSIMDKLRG